MAEEVYLFSCYGYTPRNTKHKLTFCFLSYFQSFRTIYIVESKEKCHTVYWISIYLYHLFKFLSLGHNILKLNQPHTVYNQQLHVFTQVSLLPSYFQIFK